MTELSKLEEQRLISTRLKVVPSMSSFSFTEVMTIKLKTTLRMARDMSMRTTKEA